MIKKVIKIDKRLPTILIFLCFLMPAFAQVAPITPTPTPTQMCDQVMIISKINQEHQATRKFMVDTFNQKSSEFFTEADKRMAYLENEYRTQMRNAVLKLGFLWLFITLFVYAAFGFFKIMWKKRSYNKMKADISNDVFEKIKREIKESAKVKPTQKPILETRNNETNPIIQQESADKIKLDELMAKIDSMGAAKSQ